MLDPLIAEQSAHQIVEKVQRCIDTVYNNWGLTDFQIVGAGLEFLVCRAESGQLGQVAIKTPWKRWITDSNDLSIDARQLLIQEAELATFLRTHSIATPAVHTLYYDDEIDFLVSEFVPNDRTEPDMREFGKLMRRIHSLEPPNIKLVAQHDLPCGVEIATRLARRAKVLEEIADVEFGLSSIDLLSILDGYTVKRSGLLHMDARPANLLTRERHIVGIVDWSNALIGDPALDLARIAEYGHLSADFLRGYGKEHCLEDIPKMIELIYRLDTSVMLAIVFSEDAPDQELAFSKIERVKELCVNLRHLYGIR